MSRTLYLTRAAWASVRAALDSGRRTDALFLLERYVRLGGLSPRRRGQALQLLGELRRGVGDYAAARRAFRAACRAGNRSAELFYQWGRAWLDDPLGCARRARRRMAVAVRIAPQEARYWAAYGQVAVRSGQRRRGVRALLQAARLAPANWDVLQQVLEGLLMAGRPRLAYRLLLPARFLLRTPQVRQAFEQWHRRIRYELARRDRLTPLSCPAASSLPLRAG